MATDNTLEGQLARLRATYTPEVMQSLDPEDRADVEKSIREYEELIAANPGGVQAVASTPTASEPTAAAGGGIPGLSWELGSSDPD